MAYGSPFIVTAELDQGPAVYDDTYNSAFSTYPLPYGARNPLGSRYCYQDSKGRNVIVAYVRVNCTTAPTSFVVGPVWWRDNTFTTVTANIGDFPVTGGFAAFSQNLVAGILLNTSIVNGDYTWIVVSGYCGQNSDTNWGNQINCPNSAVIGDGVVSGSSGNQTVVRAAAGTPSYKQIYTVLTNNSSNLADGLVTCEWFGNN